MIGSDEDELKKSTPFRETVSVTSPGISFGGTVHSIVIQDLTVPVTMMPSKLQNISDR